MIYNFLRQTKGELFIININNQYTFRKGYFKGQTVEYVDEHYDEFINYLYELYKVANYKDRLIIKEIKSTLKFNI